MKKVYLDYAATTPLAPEVVKAMKPYYSEQFGNPMAQHLFGEEAREAVEFARKQVADFFNVEQEEIIFTSGATESNNLAIKGVIKGIENYIEKYGNGVMLLSKNKEKEKRKEKRKTKTPELVFSDVSSYKFQVSCFTPHIITTAYEHHCVLDSAKRLEEEGAAEVTYVKPNRDGLINPSDIQRAIKPNTALVSAMYVQNEIGAINPLREIGEVVEKERMRRKEKAELAGKEGLPIYFMSDIVQGVNYLPCDMRKFGVDLFSFSGHKIYGPKGIGALGVKKGVLLEKIQDGGDQEFGLRAGTHNVPGIVGLAAAVNEISKSQSPMTNTRLPNGQEISNSKSQKTKNIEKLRNYFWEKLQKEVKNIKLNGSMEKRVANNLNVSFAGVEGESMVLILSQAGIACSTGSACSSESLEPSHVLLSIGCSHPEAHSSLRFTLGKRTTESDIDCATQNIKEAVAKLRKIAGL